MNEKKKLTKIASRLAACFDCRWINVVTWFH